MGVPNCEKGGLDEVQEMLYAVRICWLKRGVSVQAFLDLTPLIAARLPSDTAGRLAAIASVSESHDRVLPESAALWSSNACVTAPLSPSSTADVSVRLLLCGIL